MIIYSYPPQPTVSVSVPPLEFMRDGVNTPVTQDTGAPANNRPIPAGLYFYKDGVIVPVTDSATPSEVAAIPVTIKATDGTNITITAGDINIQTTSEGVTFDSQRIGDGSGVYLKVNADGSINAVTSGLTDAELRATPIPVSGTVSTGGLTDTELRATPVPVSTGLSQGLTDTELRATPVPVSTGGLTDAQIRATPLPVSGPLTDTELRATPVPVSGTVSTGGLTDAELRATAVPVSLASIPSSPAMVPSFQEIINLTTVAQTFTAPANARWCKVMTDDDNAGNVRVKIGGVATTASGMRFQPGRSEDYQTVGDISVIAESGANNKIQVQFGV